MNQELCTPEWEEAPFCKGPSDQQCSMDELSARGYCNDPEGHENERLSVICHPDNFSRECYDWRLEQFGDGYWGTNEGWHPTDCPEDVTCDDSFTDVCTDIGLSFDYSTGGCLEGEASTVTYDQPALLPEAGFGAWAVLFIAIAMLAVGYVITTWRSE